MIETICVHILLASLIASVPLWFVGMAIVVLADIINKKR
jgi:hypothetical protein